MRASDGESHRMRCGGPVSRRSFLEVGALSAAGLALPDLLRMRATARGATAASHDGRPPASKPDTAVILVWLPGGPPHHETYDMKPQAPSDIRGEFSPIPTNVKGMEVCELLPLHAKCADKYSLIRSVSHKFADHGGGHKRFLTGYDPKQPTGFVVDNPAVGSVVAKMREQVNVGLPNYISMTNRGRGGVDVYSFGAAYLGPRHTPFTIVGHPHEADFRIRNIALAPNMAQRLDDRQTLLAGVDHLRRDLDQSGAFDALDGFHQQAMTMLTSEQARQAFDLSHEPDRIRQRYGMHPWGQRALMARRLVEAGVSFVTVVMENPSFKGRPMPGDGVYNWDSHAVNCHIFNDFRFRAPIYDQAVTALIEDVHQRGLAKQVMVIVTGEFGRTPRINRQNGNGRPGRDHWPQAMSILVSGGGLRMGQVIGSTDKHGAHPVDQPLSPNDLWATMYQHLGIDPSATFPDHSGRPMLVLPHGQPIRGLV